MRIPYVYWIKNKTTGLKYVGVKYAKGCHPKEFWVSYFTSSKTIHKLIHLYGKEDFKIKILHVFDNEEEAILKEYSYTKLAINRKDYINFCAFPASNSFMQSKHGIVGGTIQKVLKLGIHKQSREERLSILEKARKIQIEQKINPLMHCSKEVQSLRGSIGGAKNKGFVWLTDGNNIIKYTRKMQNFKSTEEYLKENSNYRRGRK